jgi:hypothetical protein
VERFPFGRRIRYFWDVDDTTRSLLPFSPTSIRGARRASSLLAVVLSTALVAPVMTPLRVASAGQMTDPGVVDVEVLNFASSDGVEEASALTDAFRHALAGAPGLADNGKSHALETEALTVGCDDPMDDKCAPKIAADIKSDRFVYGTVKKSKTAPIKITATVKYYSAGTVKTVVKTYDAGPVAKDGASPELKKIALEVLLQLTGGPAKGKVEVTLTGPGSGESGDLYEGGQKIGRVEGGKATVELTTGSHAVELRISGYSTSTATIDVAPTGTTVTLNPIRLSSSKPDWQLYGGIGAIGVGAIFVGVGIATSLSIRNQQNDDQFTNYRKRFPSSEKDVCAQAKAGKEQANSTVVPSGGTALAPYVADLCDSVSSKQTLQYVWYGLGVAAIGGGTYLVLTDKKGSGEAKAASAPVKIQVAPSFGPGYGSVTLVGSF